MTEDRRQMHDTGFSTHYHSAASVAARPRLDGCAARLLLILSYVSVSVNVIELPKQKRGGAYLESTKCKGSRI